MGTTFDEVVKQHQLLIDALMTQWALIQQYGKDNYDFVPQLKAEKKYAKARQALEDIKTAWKKMAPLKSPTHEAIKQYLNENP
jgi:hypothetical protein